MGVPPCFVGWFRGGSGGFHGVPHGTPRGVPLLAPRKVCVKTQYFRYGGRGFHLDEHFLEKQNKTQKVDEHCPFKIIEGEIRWASAR